VEAKSHAADQPGVAEDEPSLSEAMLAEDPLVQFGRWMDDVVAAPLPEPTAMVLATVSASGRPRARTVLLKAYDSSGFTFYTNRTSRKATDLAEVPQACLVFPWYPIHRQVIIEGPVSPLSVADSEPYFRSRPRGSQLGRVRAQGGGVDVIERLPPRAKPARELLDVHAVRPLRRVRQLGRIEKALNEGAVRHPDGFALLPRSPASEPSRRSLARGSGSSRGTRRGRP